MPSYSSTHLIFFTYIDIFRLLYCTLHRGGISSLRSFELSPGLFSLILLRSVHALVPDVYAQCMHQFLMRMLSVRISSKHACSVHASVPYAHAVGIQDEHLKNGITDAHAEHGRKELMRLVKVCISS
jgi:hypothetical protein